MNTLLTHIILLSSALSAPFTYQGHMKQCQPCIFFTELKPTLDSAYPEGSVPIFSKENYEKHSFILPNEGKTTLMDGLVTVKVPEGEIHFNKPLPYNILSTYRMCDTNLAPCGTQKAQVHLWKATKYTSDDQKIIPKVIFVGILTAGGVYVIYCCKEKCMKKKYAKIAVLDKD